MVWPMIAAAAVSAVGSAYSANRASSAARGAADTSSAAQMAQLDYLKEQERIPSYYRDQAMGMLAQEFGIPQYMGNQEGYDPATGRQITGYEETRTRNPEYDQLAARIEGGSGRDRLMLQQQLNRMPEFLDEKTPILGQIGGPVKDMPQGGAPQGGMPQGMSMVDRAKNSPLYQALMATRGAGEEAIMRQGQLGSLGGRAKGISDYNRNLEEDALLKSYNQQLQGLGSFTGYQGFTPQIAQTMGNIGQTQAMGQLGAAQAQQAGIQGITGSIAGGLNSYYRSTI